MKISTYILYSLLFFSLPAYTVEPESVWQIQGISLVNKLQAFLKDEISRPQFSKDISFIKQKLDPAGLEKIQIKLDHLKQNIVLDNSINKPIDLANNQAPIEINPGFSCYDAGIDSEYAVCANPQLSAYDLEMSYLYYKKLAKLQNVNLIKQFKVGQNTWRKNRNQCIDDIKCLTASYQLRINQLK